MNHVRIGVAVLIIVMWALGYALAYVGVLTETPSDLLGLALLAAGWLFGTDIRQQLKRGKDEPNGT